MVLSEIGFFNGISVHLFGQVSASGPIVTLFQGALAFIFLYRSKWNKYVYLLLFTAFYMRFLAGLMNFINLNDEGRISVFLNLGIFTLPILVSGLLFYMTYKVSVKWSLGWPFQLYTTLIIMFISSALILVDQFYGIHIIG